MTRYRKLPIVIDAWRIESGWFDQDGDGPADFMPLPLVAHVKLDQGTRQAFVPTVEGVMSASVGAWIIRGVKGEFYPCSDEVFRLTYEEADMPPGSSMFRGDPQNKAGGDSPEGAE